MNSALREFVRLGAERFYPRTGQQLPKSANGAGVFMICCQIDSKPNGEIQFNIMEVGHGDNMAELIRAYSMHHWNERCTGQVFFYMSRIADPKERANLARLLKEQSISRSA